MAFWQARDSLFCGVCGTLLNFDSLRSASCPLCGFKRRDEERPLFCGDIEGEETLYGITAEEAPNMNVVEQRPVVDATCPKCKHPKLEYLMKQLRSADEEMTTFYFCPNPECKHTFSEIGWPTKMSCILGGRK